MTNYDTYKRTEFTLGRRLKLEKGFHNAATHNYRIRCKVILLKSSDKSASQKAEILDVTIPTIYARIRCYEESGIIGLETRLGQGRKPIMDCSDEELIRKAIIEGHLSLYFNANGNQKNLKNKYGCKTCLKCCQFYSRRIPSHFSISWMRSIVQGWLMLAVIYA